MSWFYWFSNPNNKLNSLKDLNSKDSEVFSKEKFDELNASLKLLTLEKDDTETLLAEVRDELLGERNENESLRAEISRLESKLHAIVAIATSDYFSASEFLEGDLSQEQVIKTEDIINGLNDLSFLDLDDLDE